MLLEARGELASESRLLKELEKAVKNTIHHTETFESSKDMVDYLWRYNLYSEIAEDLNRLKEAVRQSVPLRRFATSHLELQTSLEELLRGTTMIMNSIRLFYQKPGIKAEILDHQAYLEGIRVQQKSASQVSALLARYHGVMA